MRRCAQALGARVEWVPGGHDVMLDGPRELVLDVVLHWVDQVCPQGPALLGARLTSPLQLK